VANGQVQRMMPVAGPRGVFISVAEDSADVHAAALIRRAAELLPECRFYGLTGPRMRAAGAETVYDLTAHAAMLTGVFSVIRRAREALRAVEQAWHEARPDLVVLLDSPELHLRLAKRARRMGLPVLYYIAPQTWASRAYRNRQIARDVDRLACILPFEEAYFRRAGVHAEFVGHPLFETLERERANAATLAQLASAAGPLLALLPGSRRHVIDALLPRQLAVVRQLRERGIELRAAISCVSSEREDQIRGHLRTAGAGAALVVSDNASLLTAADLVLVASGTATLQVAHYRKPMIVMYDAGRWLRWPYRLFGRWVLTTPHLALVNVLAGARVVPEFMPFVRDTRAIAEVAARLLVDADWRRLMVRQLDEAVRPLATSWASERVCEIMGEMLSKR
jgi:lipid-A-disaccharide synthase